MDKVYTVSQVNSYVKTMFQRNDVLSHIYMKGELSNCKYHTSGHIYFTLKDETGQISCVMFARSASSLTFRLKEGLSVIALGSISVYERDGKYQLYAEEIVRDGVGLLYERFEQLKSKLANEGLFDPQHKKEIPRYAKRIGIVTAKTGAAIQDIISISRRRNPYVQLILYPAQVQGEQAYRTVIRGIRALERCEVDVIIVGRGGGSIEDLWAFNEEALARCIYECPIPIISAVGHETDVTIADYVADLRAPTPSAAAELSVFRIDDVMGAMVDGHSELYQLIMTKIRNFRLECERYQLKLKVSSPVSRMNQQRQTLLELEEKLSRVIHQNLTLKRHKIGVAIEKMKGLSPLDKLKQGFSYVSDLQGENINSITGIQEGNQIQITVTDGSMIATVNKIKNNIQEDWQEG